MTLQVPGEHASGSAEGRFAYDVFVVHADAAADEAFVNGYLLTKLGLAPKRVLRLQTLELGRFVADEIERGVRSSRVTILVLSTAYMDDRWAAFSEQLARYASIARDVHGQLIPLLLEDGKLTMSVQSLVKLDFRDPSRGSWEAEIERLRGYLDRPWVPEPDLACPYPGMRPFTEGDAARFFGREVELDSIVYRLRQGERELYIIGASGSGKSSLIGAGLVPRLLDGIEGLPRFHARTLRPGERPLERLCAALECDVATREDPVEYVLRRHAPATSLLLVIDQLEELFAIANEAQRRDFLAMVRVLRTTPGCVLLFTLRADFYGAFLSSSLWTDNDGRISRIDLGPLGSDSLRTVIERPARDVGVYVEPQLVSQLLDDASREPGALPLLQETLFQLWGKRRQCLLTLADYHALSNGVRTGLAFAVEKHADFVLGRLTSSQRLIAFRILLRLVNFGEGRADTRRQQRCNALRSAGEAVADFDTVLQCLVAHRLVTVTGDDQRDDVRVDLAHEILIEAWGTFAEHIKIWRAHEQQRRELESAATAWRASGCGDGLLGPVRLAAAVAWRERSAQQLGCTVDLAVYLEASEVAQAAALRQESDQREERNRLLLESAQYYQDAGRQRLEADGPLAALPYLVAARQATEGSGNALSASLRMLFARATWNLPVSPPLPHQGVVVSAAFSPDGSRVVTASSDKTARVWDVMSGEPRSPSLQHQGEVWVAAFSPDGSRVVTASSDRTARVWDATSGEPCSPSLQHQGIVWSAAFSPDGTCVITASSDRTARVWDVATGEPRAPSLQHQDIVWSAAFSVDGTRAITASSDRTARIWDVVTGEPLSPLLRHPGAVVGAAFSPDGTCAVTASDDRTARVWDAVTGRPISPPLHHQDAVLSAAFSPDGTRVVTAGWDNMARVWDAATGRPISLPLHHQDAVLSAAFSPDGTRIVTASRDRTGRVWDVATGRPISLPLHHQDAVASAAFSPDGSRIVTASRDCSGRVWDAFRELSPLLQHKRDVVSAAFSPDGSRIVTASLDRTARIWNATTGEPLSRTLHHQGEVWCAAFSPDGTRVATASSDRTACIWHIDTGKALSPTLHHQESVVSAAFSPDGTRIVTASLDQTARVWDAVTGKPISRPLQHDGPVVSAAFSPDGTHVVTASRDKTARVWTPPPACRSPYLCTIRRPS